MGGEEGEQRMVFLGGCTKLENTFLNHDSDPETASTQTFFYMYPR